MPISFSAGVDNQNFPDCVALGFTPVTTCTDLLRPGGYGRLPKYLERLEERMRGPECSLLALCDGRVARALPLAQDHKRIGEGDTGANTGGMGAYAPAPVPHDAADLVATFVQPILDHFAATGTPYVACGKCENSSVANVDVNGPLLPDRNS